MDFGYLLRILARRKWLIAGAMLTAAVATFLLIGLRPEKYKASVILATGIVNYKGINSDNSDAFVQQYQVQNAFSNLIEFVLSRSSMKILTIHMLKHDLSAGANQQEQPYRKANPKLSQFSQEEQNQLIAELAKINLDSINDPSFSQQFDYLLDKIARAYGYDHDALRRSIDVKRKGETDYLSIEVVTENPQLSQVMANTFAGRFLAYYHNISVREKRKNVETYSKLAADKKFIVDSINNVRFEYLKAKGLPVLGKQSEELVGQITKLEIERQRADSRKKAAAGSVERIKKYEDNRESRDAREVQARVEEKNNTIDQMERVRELTQRSLETKGKDADVEAELAEAKTELNNAVRSSARVQGKLRTDESKRTREDLYKERVSTDLDRIDAEENYDRLNNEIWKLKGQLGNMVVNDEISSRIEKDEERALAEFNKVNDELINAKLNLENAENPLSVVENAQLPEWPEPNRQTLISVFAAIVVGTLTIIALFVLAYLDKSLQSPDLFKRYTNQLPLLGSISAVPVKGLDFEELFAGKNAARQVTTFREGLRRLRSALLQTSDRIYLFVSLKGMEGKTFTMHALAHSLAANHKKVLMLDTNFKTPLSEKYTDTPTPNSALLNKLIRDHGFSNVFLMKNASEDLKQERRVDIIGNVGIHKSPAEILDEKKFRQLLTALGEHYDYIFMEAASLTQYSDAYELVPFADKVIAVFNAKSSIGHADAETLDNLRDLREKFAGAILTEVDARNMN